jgi:hypothetical protein
MISVTDSQLRIVATAADLLPGEARGKFLRRVVAELREDQDFKDVDVEHEIAPETTGHGLPLSKCEAYNRVYDQPYESR